MQAARILYRNAVSTATRRACITATRSVLPQRFFSILHRSAAPGLCHSVGRRLLHIEVLSGEPVHTADKLRSVLEKEINHETETYEGSPPDIDDFLAEAGWEMEDFDGSREIYLRKTIGDEEVNITFGIMDPEQSPSISDDEVETEEPPMIVPFTVCITKKANGQDAGTITAEMMTDDGRCVLQQLTFNTNSDDAMGDSAEDYEDRLSNYPGPNLHDLDPDVKESLVHFFSSRGVDDNLAAFIERVYYDKEQREYVNWLKSLHDYMSK